MQTCELRHFVEPCLLLLLRERPDHGYELVDRLRILGLADGDSASIYRTLRGLERNGLVRSVWRPSSTGPARRTYSLTGEGTGRAGRADRGGPGHPADAGHLSRPLQPGRPARGRGAGVTGALAEVIRVRIRVRGIVQGVGYRPFVHALAGGSGWPGSSATTRRACSPRPRVRRPRWRSSWPRCSPGRPRWPGSSDVDHAPLLPTGAAGFAVVASTGAGARRSPVPADTATCDDCLAELRDPADRRYRYPFLNCTNCGPRFTDRHRRALRPAADDDGRVRDVRRVRARSTHDPADRRFHAQPVCCPACGPRLALARRRPASRCPATRSGRGRAAAARRRGAGGQGPRRLPPGRGRARTSRPRRRCGRASTGRSSRSR